MVLSISCDSCEAGTSGGSALKEFLSAGESPSRLKLRCFFEESLSLRPRTAVELAQSRIPPGHELYSTTTALRDPPNRFFRLVSSLPPDTKTLVKLLRKPPEAQQLRSGVVAEPAVRLRPAFEKWPRAEAVPPKFASSRDRWTWFLSRPLAAGRWPEAVAADENECDFRRRQLHGPKLSVPPGMGDQDIKP